MVNNMLTECRRELFYVSLEELLLINSMFCSSRNSYNQTVFCRHRITLIKPVKFLW